MDIVEQCFGYLMDMEEDSAAKIIKEGRIKFSTMDVIMTEFDEWYAVAAQIQIRGKYLKGIESTYLNEKKIIEEILVKFANLNNQLIKHIEWLPLPRIVTEISKYNTNDQLKQFLLDENIDEFFLSVKSIFASLSYNIKITEGYFHSNIHTLLKTIGFNIISESETNLGRIDSVIELDDIVYIIEFKTSKPEIALEQIKRKKYYEKYLSTAKKILLIGVACSIQEKNIDKWIVEEYR